MKRALSPEIKNVVVWIEKQPDVHSVVQGRYTRQRHKHKAGFARIYESDEKIVKVRAFDREGSRELFVHAPKTANREAWTLALTESEGFSQNGKEPKVVRAQVPAGVIVRRLSTKERTPVPTPEPIQADAASLYLVTPEIALKWLESNTRNRKLYQNVVERYAADMKAGRWLITGDAIQFDTGGAIINGQHRLWAVVESGTPAHLMVAFGLPPESVAVLDDHLKRNLADVAKLSSGRAVTNKHTGIANMLIQSSIASTREDAKAAFRRVTRQQQLDTLERHFDAIEFAARECMGTDSIRGITVASVMTPLARAYYSQDRERLKQFGKVLTTGIMEGKDDAAAVVLRNLLVRASHASSRIMRDTIYKKTERALQAFLEREQVKNLYEAASELFPLPEETAAGKRVSRRRQKRFG